MSAPHELYAQLMALTSAKDTFFFKDFPADSEETMYRIFNYRLGQYTDWLEPGALECRGTMFLVERDGTYVDLVCRTPKKFFNLNENPFTMGLDLTDPAMVMLKEDGSLMSTYLHTCGKLRLKSKGSTGSDQANDAMKFLGQPDQAALLADLKFLASRDMTVNLEWCAPWNRIVVGYNKPSLVGISVIDNQTGTQYFREFVEDLGLAGLADAWVDDYEYQGDLAEWVKNVTDHEGVVAMTKSGTMVKIKSDWYLALHRSKDSVNNPKALIEVILNEGSDDLKTMFFGDDQVIGKIAAYETKIANFFNETCADVESWYEGHKDIGRKEYAIAAQFIAKHGNIPEWMFGVLMSKYLGKDYQTQIKENILKNYRDFLIPGFDGPSEE